MIKTLYDDAKNVRMWWKQAPRSFKDYLQDYIKETLDRLKHTSDTTEMFRLQGELSILETLDHLEEELNAVEQEKQ